MARIAPLFSGSSGNCVAIGGSDSFVLIDAGVPAKSITEALTERGLDVGRLAGIFVTHEHGDHIRGIRVLASRRDIPVYATAGTLCALDSSGHLAGVRSEVCPGEGVELAGIHIRPFRTMHDAVESCGYIVTTSDGRRVAFATDMGCVTDAVREALTGCDLIYIESNHDIEMLTNGPYNFVLKRRILSNRGHLSNAACAAELTDLARSGTARFILGHLSQKNNVPELAAAASRTALTGAGLREGVDYTLSVATPCGLPVTVF